MRVSSRKETTVQGKDIIPFVKAVENVLSTMLSLQVDIGEPKLRSSQEPEADVSGIISVFGDMQGAVVMGFPTATAEALASLFIGVEVSSDSEDFADAVGELANMVAGNAKAEFTGKNLTIGCPSVVIGKGHKVFQHRDLPVLQIPCTCDCGEFVVEVSMRENTNNAPAAEPEVAEVSA
jgi:chemotaxis protein CheX